MQNNTTEYLIKRAKRKDADAFTELMQNSMQGMYKVALAILSNDEDAADAIQDTILICWEKIGTLVHAKFFRTWLTRILINKCYDIQRRNRNIVQFDEYAEPSACDEYNVELKEALAVLEEKYRVIVVLFYGEGYRIREIAELLNLPENTVKTRLSRGRQKLAEYYRER